MPFTAKAALLQVLLLDGEGFGLELQDRICERTKGRFKVGQGSLYPALRELEKNGLVVSHEGAPLPERGGRPRRYYKLTSQGKRVAMQHRASIESLFK